MTQILKEELKKELGDILRFWEKNAIDKVYGGFVGRRDFFNNLVEGANKGAILNTRILWTFSAVYGFYGNKEHERIAIRAFDYLKKHFRDQKYGGIYWEVDYKGHIVNDRKQVYAQAFAIYALSEFYLTTGNKAAIRWALELFEDIEQYSRDWEKNGYIEAFQRDWSPIHDMRLSDKDLNAAKTMNTHLHILEAYINLYRATRSNKVKESLKNMVHLFHDKFLNKENGHLQLFFGRNWESKSNMVSFGHDIEAVWLMMDASNILKNEFFIRETEKALVLVSEVFLEEAVQLNGSILNEKDLKTGSLDTDRHWWPHFEAMVGLLYAYNITQKRKFAEAQQNIWEYAKNNLKDNNNGEWYFRIDQNDVPYKVEDKISMWKAPYHSTRALMKLLS
ncbi:MAG: N-acylglucosamine 2-epimerase [Algicola sp.]|nr:N-acylglucosamine 2-epimerase [Algicola sp.]